MTTTNINSDQRQKMEDVELKRTTEPIKHIVPPPLILSPNADPTSKYPPLRRKSSSHVFYNFTKPVTPLSEPNEIGLGRGDSGEPAYLLPEPAVSIAYRKKLDVVE